MNKKIVGIAKTADEMHKNERKTKKMKDKLTRSQKVVKIACNEKIAGGICDDGVQRFEQRRIISTKE